MPAGKLKNAAYGALLPLLGLQCQWKPKTGDPVENALYRRRAVGACVQRFEKGALTDCLCAGYASLGPERRPVTEHTVFRTASIAKTVNALLVLRLQTLGRLCVTEPVADFLGYPVANPRFPDAPITLGMMLNHTSSIVDSPAYFASFSAPDHLRALLTDERAFSASLPGLRFHYSNLAAGAVGCMLEKRFQIGYEELAQKELFGPLGVKATFDASTLKDAPPADGYRVLPKALCFSGAKRAKEAPPIDGPAPESHYLLAAGGLYVTAPELARLLLAAWNGANGFLNDECLSLLHTPTADWPEKDAPMRHCMGLAMREVARPFWGHQGFAYGAVNGAFFDGEGNGFVLLNSGVSEQRFGHLAMINHDLIRLLIG